MEVIFVPMLSIVFDTVIVVVAILFVRVNVATLVNRVSVSVDVTFCVTYKLVFHTAEQASVIVASG